MCKLGIKAIGERKEKKIEKMSPKTGGVENSHESRNVHPKETDAR